MKNKILITIGILFLALGPLSLITGIAYTLTLPKIYSGKSTVMVEFPESQQKYTADALEALTRQKAELVNIRPVLETVVENNNLREVWENNGIPLPIDRAIKILKNSVVANTGRAVGLIDIIVLRQDPKEASMLSNEISEAFKNSQDNISIIETAVPTVRPVSPNLFLNVLMSMIQGGICMIIGAVLILLGKRKKKVQQSN